MKDFIDSPTFHPVFIRSPSRSRTSRKTLVDNVKVDAEAVRGQDIVARGRRISEVGNDQCRVGTDSSGNGRREYPKNDHDRRNPADLPQAGRDPYELARLAPGVFGAGARAADGNSSLLPNTSGPGGSNNSIFATENAQPISANGQRVSANNYQVDGTSVNSQTWGGAAVITPSQESVKEVQVTSSTYSAEDGRNSGAQVKVVTQNGTNDWHGSVFYKIERSELNAYNKFNGVPGVVRRYRHGLNANSNLTAEASAARCPIFGSESLMSTSLTWARARTGCGSSLRMKVCGRTTRNPANALIETAAYRQAIINSRPGTVSAALVFGCGSRTEGPADPAGHLCFGGHFGSLPGCPGRPGHRFDSGHATAPISIRGFPAADSTEFLTCSLHSWRTFRNFSGQSVFYQDRLACNTRRTDFRFRTFFVPVTNFTSDLSAQSRPQADINSERFNLCTRAYLQPRNFSATLLNEARFNITSWGFDESSTNPQANFGLPRIEIEAILRRPSEIRSPPRPEHAGALSTRSSSTSETC